MGQLPAIPSNKTYLPHYMCHKYSYAFFYTSDTYGRRAGQCSRRPGGQRRYDEFYQHGSHFNDGAPAVDDG